jgi:hypothetical protein
VLLDRARLSLPCRAEGYRPAGVVALILLEESLLVSYEYRLFLVQQAKKSTFLHVTDERLRDGMVVEVERPGQRTRWPLRDRLLRAHAPARWKARDRLRPRVASAGRGAGVGRRASG